MQERRRYVEELRKELRVYVFLPFMEVDMPIVLYVLVRVTNGIPDEAQVKTYEHELVGVVGFCVASSFAPTSTVS